MSQKSRKKIRLSADRIRTAKSPSILRDSEVLGLQLRCNKKTKVWQLPTRLKSGERPTLILGHYPTHPNGVMCDECLTVEQARDTAIELRARIRKGEDPREKAEPIEPDQTFGHVAMSWLAMKETLHNKAAKKGASFPEWERQVRTYLQPGRIGGDPLWTLDVAAITPRHLVRFLAPIQASTPSMARVLKSTLSSIFKHAQSQLLIEFNPARGFTLEATEEERQREVTVPELCRLWPYWTYETKVERSNGRRDYELEDRIAGAVHMLVLLTLQRGKEVRHFEWSKIDFQEGVVTLQPTITVGGRKMNLIKNRHAHRVPLSPQALRVIESMRPLTGGSRWVFPSPRTPRKDSGEKPFSRPVGKCFKARHRFCDAAGIDDFQMRDLRAAGGTILSKRWEVEEHLLAVIYNHKPKHVTGRVYLRHKDRYFGQAQKALHQLGAYIEAVTSHQGAQVVSIHG